MFFGFLVTLHTKLWFFIGFFWFFGYPPWFLANCLLKPWRVTKKPKFSMHGPSYFYIQLAMQTFPFYPNKIVLVPRCVGQRVAATWCAPPVPIAMASARQNLISFYFQLKFKYKSSRFCPGLPQTNSFHSQLKFEQKSINFCPELPQTNFL